MKRIILLAICALVAAGSTVTAQAVRYVPFPEPAEIEDCEGAPAGPPLQIFYGDSKIIVNHVHQVHQNEILKIQLHPDSSSVEEGVDYENVEVMLIGKTPNSQWLNRKFKASDSVNNTFDICVGARETGHYYYLIDVPGVGQIDPRVDIIPSLGP